MTTGDGPRAGAVAYVLKGFPRMSEIFIASEIARLEELGMSLRLYVTKPGDGSTPHEVVGRIRAPRIAITGSSPSLSGTKLRAWLRVNMPTAGRALGRAARRHPVGLARATWAATAQAFRSRKRPIRWGRKMYLREFLQAVAIADDIDRTDVRHIHAHFAHGATTVAWLAAMIVDLPLSFTGHARDVYSESLNPNGLLRRKVDAASFVVTCTDANRRHLEALGSTTPVHCIYHGLNADFSRLVAGDGAVTPRAGDGTLRLLAVGRIVPKKGFDTMIDACALLRDAGVPLEAVIAGEDGAHSDLVRRRIAAFGLDEQIRLVGPMSQSELHEQYRAANAFCLPCRILDDGDRDGVPNVLVEAMACAVPVVSTDVSGIPELVEDGRNGFLVPPDDPVLVAERLRLIHRDPELAARLGSAGRDTVLRRFDGAALARQLAALFDAPR